MGRTPVRYGVGVATDLRSHLGTPVVRAPLPIAPSFAPLFADGGLVRGRTVACTGDAALSTALALAASATRLGSWLAVIGVPQLGVGAAIEAGVHCVAAITIGNTEECHGVDHQARSLFAHRVSCLLDLAAQAGHQAFFGQQSVHVFKGGVGRRGMGHGREAEHEDREDSTHGPQGIGDNP